MSTLAKRGAVLLLRPVRRVLLMLLRARLAWSMRGDRRGTGDWLRIRILLQHAYGMGGTIRTTLNLAGYLARRHDVEIVSVGRWRNKPFFPWPEGVRVTFADDRTGTPGRWQRLLSRLPTLLTPPYDNTFRGTSLWTDLMMMRVLCAAPADVLIGTRPSLNLLIARAAPRGIVTIGQDHMNLGAYRPGLRQVMRRDYPGLDVLTVLTDASLHGYRAMLGDTVRVVRIPNAVPVLGGEPCDQRATVVVAAGRLTRQKGFDLLLAAYEQVARAHPDWQLHIFGGGPERDALRKQIAERGLAGTVRLRGKTADLGAEFARAGMFVLSSRFEGMPMVIIEAMSKGLPVVAFDCPTGPADLIEHGRNGLLVPAGDAAALGAALSGLIEDAGLRRRLGEQALRSSCEYDIETVGARWTQLIAELTGGPAAPPPGDDGTA